MQIMLNLKTVTIGAVVALAGYYGYKSFYGDIQTKDIGKLVQAHRMASSLKRRAIRSRIIRLYKPQKDYETLLAALEHRSAITQALAVDVLTECTERRAVDKLLKMLQDPDRAARVKEALAEAFRVFPRKAAVPRLIELTHEREEHDVRNAAHDTLVALLHTGAQIKFGSAMHENWTDWWQDHHHSVRLP